MFKITKRIRIWLRLLAAMGLMDFKKIVTPVLPLNTWKKNMKLILT